MSLNLLLFLSLTSLTLAAIDTLHTPTKCNADNCARAVSGTRGGPGHLKTASADCSSALVITDFPFGVTITSWLTWAEETSTVFVTATPTVIANANSDKRQIDFRPIPPYATPCVDYFAYSSACSCLGIIATVVTDTTATTETIYWWDFITTTTTVTVSASTTSTSSSSSLSLTTPTSTTASTTPPTPTCTANTLTDPLNCGSCGTVCLSGVCEQGSCTNTQCRAQSCGDITNCSSNASCFCFASTSSLTTNAGFCGSNGVCSELTPCATDEDCSSSGSSTSGNICAIKTCCAEESDELPGVCLQGLCGNPSRRLAVLAREWAARRVGRRGLTAAF